MQPQDEVGYLVLLDDAHDCIRYVDIVPEQGVELYVCRSRRLLCLLKNFVRLSVGTGVRLLVVDDVQRIDACPVVFPLY